MKPKTGVAIIHYNRINQLQKQIQAVKDTCSKRVKIVVCDDGSPGVRGDYEMEDRIEDACRDVILIRGPNKGVAANKNRGLFVLQDMDLICLLEDDLFPTREDWITHYEKAVTHSGIHHFCRVQDKEAASVAPDFDEYMLKQGLTPIYGSSPRGDFTFITKRVIKEVGGLNKRFKGVGYAHGEWSARVNRAGLIRHPNMWIDIKEGRDSFIQVGDTTGGRWDDDQHTTGDLSRNKKLRQRLDASPYIYDRLELQ